MIYNYKLFMSLIIMLYELFDGYSMKKREIPQGSCVLK